MNPRPQATSTPLVETDRTIVTERRFAPGAETGWHRHAHDYVVVVLTAGKLMQETANGKIVTDLGMGQSYARNSGVEHNVLNPNPHEFVPLKGVLKRIFVEVELK
jgi:beta-alanine degradation protein BauB